MRNRSSFPAIVALGFVAAAVIVLLLVGPGDNHPATVPTLPNGAPKPLLRALGCHVSPTAGVPGACAPRPLSIRRLLPSTALPGPRFIDLSNNNPVSAQGMRAIKARGYVGVIVKVNQAGYRDPTAAGMVHAARAVGLKVGGYGFADPTRVGPIQEAHFFVAYAKQAGVCGGQGVFPATLDAEYGNITRGYVAVWVGIVRHACGSVQIYTGQWYWNPHVGCYWPSGVRGWVSAYGVSDVRRYLPCGLGALLLEHQYTDREFNGANTADASTFFGSSSQLDTYTGAKPKPAPLIPPSKWARRRCLAANDLRHHRRHPLTRHQQARLQSHIAFFRRNHLSCYGPRVRRIR
jgi:hypothetical protein